MNPPLLVLGEALMDCVMQPNGSLLPLTGGSPLNLARAAALRGASVGYVNPISIDTFWGNCLGDWVLHPQGSAQRVEATLRQAMLAAAINCARAGCHPPTHVEVQGSTLSFS